MQLLRGLARVVAAESLARASAEVEGAVEVVGVRAGCVVDDRMRALLVELRVGPRRSLTARVLREIHLVWARSKRLRCARGGEVHLGHLPVALVLVSEVVEGVVEPVLDRELVRMQRISCQVGVDARPSGAVPAPELPLVVAPGAEWVAGEVEVVPRRSFPQVARAGRALHD